MSKFTPEFIAETRKSIKDKSTKIISKGIMLDMLDEIEKQRERIEYLEEVNKILYGDGVSPEPKGRMKA